MGRVIIPPGMRLASVWVAWAFLAIGALGWALFVLLDAFDVKKDAAAWVQAIGSIAAIVGAFMVAHRTHQLERKLRAEEVLQTEIDVLYFAENAVFEAYSAVHHTATFAGRDFSVVNFSRLEEVQYTLRFLLHKPLPAEAFSCVFIVQSHVSSAIVAAHRIVNRPVWDGGEVTRSVVELKRLSGALKSVRSVIAGLYRSKAQSAGIVPNRRPEDNEHL